MVIFVTLPSGKSVFQREKWTEDLDKALHLRIYKGAIKEARQAANPILSKRFGKACCLPQAAMWGHPNHIIVLQDDQIPVACLVVHMAHNQMSLGQMPFDQSDINQKADDQSIPPKNKIYDAFIELVAASQDGRRYGQTLMGETITWLRWRYNRPLDGVLLSRIYLNVDLAIANAKKLDLAPYYMDKFKFQPIEEPSLLFRFISTRERQLVLYPQQSLS